MRRLIRLAGALICCLSLNVQAQSGFLPQARAFLLEFDGIPLWQKDADTALAPASLTKLMTALLVAEQARLDDVVTIGRAAAAETGSRIGLKPGEKLRQRDLLAAALIHSANDACHALADALAGSESAFVARMNQRAAQLGLNQTHFANACGHDQPKHRSSARDLAKLATQAMQLPVIAQYVALPTHEISTVGGGRKFPLTNKNALIGRYPGATGIKSGFTAGAGKCLIASAQRQGHRALLVLLDAENRWWDATDILDRAFAEHTPAS